MSNIWNLLSKRFPSNEYALLQEVRDKAGFHASRSADGIAMNLYPSRGLTVTGLELKSSRGDWLNEKKKPEKAENIFKYCDYWYLVCDKEGICKIEEVPDTWGLLVAKGNKLFTIKEAPKLSPQPLDRHFIAAMLKRSTKGMIPESCISEKVEEALKERIDSEICFNKNQTDRLEKELGELTKAVREFECSSGIKLYGWQATKDKTKLGEAVRFILDGGLEKTKTTVASYSNYLKQISNELDKINSIEV